MSSKYKNREVRKNNRRVEEMDSCGGSDRQLILSWAGAYFVRIFPGFLQSRLR
jgi:hypothetical protein